MVDAPQHDGETSQPTVEIAPRFRRFLAWLADLLVTVAISQFLFGLVAYFIPPDSAGTMWPPLTLGLLVGFAYLGFATPVAGNLLGKLLFGIKTVGIDGPPSGWRWLGRVLLVGFWPVNGFMVLFGGSRRHLGDLAAKTRVVLVQPGRNFFVGLAGMAVVVFLAMQLGQAGMKIGILNAPSYVAARAHLQHENQDADVALFPEGFQVVNSQALFDFEVGDEYRRVSLERVGSRWQVLQSLAVTEPSTGVNISFGAVSSSSSP